MFVDWDALEFVGIKHDTPVSVRGITTFETALLMMLGQASVALPKGEVIGYEIIHGVIVISLSSVLDHGRFRPMHPRPDSQATYDAQVKSRQVIRMNYVKPTVVGVMLNHIESQTGVKMSVDWTSMEKVGAKRDMAFEMNVGAVPGDMALHLVLRRVNRRLTGRDRLGYGIIDGVMHVSSGSSLSRMAEARAKKIQAVQKK